MTWAESATADSAKHDNNLASRARVQKQGLGLSQFSVYGRV